MIVGSDIIYSAVILEPLAKTMAHYLNDKNDKARAYIANNKVRYDYHGHKFEEEITKAGLTIEKRIDLIEDNER